MAWYRFKVLIYSEDTYEEEYCIGMYLASSYSEACKQLEDWYGKALISIHYLKFVSDVDTPMELRESKENEELLDKIEDRL